MGFYSEQYIKVINSLTRQMVMYSGTPFEIILKEEQRLEVKLPDALREFYVIAGQLDKFNKAHNTLYDPSEWFIDDNKLVFMEENQAVVFWGIEINKETGDNPPVYQGVNANKIEWSLEHKKLSEFLITMLYWQVVNGGHKYGAYAEINLNELNKLKENWLFVGQINELQTFAKNGKAMCIFINNDSINLSISGDTQEDLAEIEEELQTIGISPYFICDVQ
ncbi:MAG: hypothetical protein AB1489_32065 [Acidobacteriota bacterium]